MYLNWENVSVMKLKKSKSLCFIVSLFFYFCGKPQVIKGVFTLVMLGWIKTNYGVIVIAVNLSTKQADCFRTNSGAVQIKYECNMDQILLNELKTGYNDKMRRYVTWFDDTEYPKQN